jgi:hypothetical protein
MTYFSSHLLPGYAKCNPRFRMSSRAYPAAAYTSTVSRARSRERASCTESVQGTRIGRVTEREPHPRIIVGPQ